MAEEEEEEKGGSKKKLFMIIGGVVALAAGGFFFMGGGGEEAAAEEMVEPEVVEGEVLDVGTMTIVLADEDPDKLRYLRVGLALVLNETADSSLIAGKVSLIQDAAITVISDMTSAELRGAAGAQDARDRLTAAAQEIYPDGAVIRVVLTEMILQ